MSRLKRLRWGDLMPKSKKTASSPRVAARMGVDAASTCKTEVKSFFSRAQGKEKSWGNSAASQRARILRHLKEHGPLTTLEARHQLDIMHPGMRICELRKRGLPIITLWCEDLSPEGYAHRVARYVLLKTPQQLALPGMTKGGVE